MCRLPKATGGRRPIAMMRSLVRWWSRARSCLSEQWLLDHPSADIWGMSAGRTSSDSAFDLNLETEVAECLGEEVLAVSTCAREFFETIKPIALLTEACVVGMPLRLVWPLPELYRRPRRLRAFGSLSYAVRAFQGVLHDFSCGHRA